MHAPKVSTFDLTAMTHAITGLDTYPVARAERTAHGLHVQRPMPGHPTLAAQEVHVLPGLDLVVTHFTPRPGHPPHSRAYLDMASVQATETVWTVRDLYLDVIVQPDGVPVLVDEDEYAEAVLEGHITPDEQRRALRSAARVVNGLYRHGTLEAWLETLGVQLHWWSETVLS